MTPFVREYTQADLPRMMEIWNEVVREGIAFPQEEELTPETAREFFASQSFTGVAQLEDGSLGGLYILHPNNVGRCGHICNASYAVDSPQRGDDATGRPAGLPPLLPACLGGRPPPSSRPHAPVPTPCFSSSAS